MIRAVIIEDEIKSLNNLINQLAKNCPEVVVESTADTIEDGLKLLSNPATQPDVVFLDIHLPDGLVFQMLNQIKEKYFDIIFITSFDQYGIQACNFSSIGYILKPIDPDELKEAVGRIHTGRNNQIEARLDVFTTQQNNPNNFEKMSISALDGIYFINIRDIIRFEAEDNYTHIYLNNGDKLTACKTIKIYEMMLSPANFFRVHKSHVINLNYMKKFIKGDGGYVVMEDGVTIEVSRRRRPAFMEQLRRIQEGL